MDRLTWQFLICGVFLPLTIEAGSPCLIDNCSNEYRTQMDRNQIEEAEPSIEYCEILAAYQKCIKSIAGRCRGNILYHTIVKATEKLADKNCPLNGKPRPPKAGEDRTPVSAPPTAEAESYYPSPGCRYLGQNVFRHCGLFGDPHLKTFDGKYQTCRVQGEWYLINNPYMSVAITNEFVDETNTATAPTKIVIVIKSGSTPCTLEKRYEANSNEGRLPSTFVDGTDRPGADETVSLRFQRNDRENYETVEIRMKYVATRLVVRRIGKYLAFSAQLPEEVIRSSAGQQELCTAACPAHELLRNVPHTTRPRYKIDREEALAECRSVESLGADFRNNLTGSFLEWCVFDLMTAGLSYDFITVAHVAQADAHGMDPSTAQDGAEPLLWQVDDESERQPSTGGGTRTAGADTHILVVVQLMLMALLSATCYPCVTSPWLWSGHSRAES